MWRVPGSLKLAQSLVPNLETSLSQLIAATGRPVDNLYSRIGFVTGDFFPKGWGDLGVVNFEEDLKLIQDWPPVGIKLDWKEVEAGTKDGQPYKLYEAAFKTPCVRRVYDALPPESRTGRVQFLVPTGPAVARRPRTLAGAGSGGGGGDGAAGSSSSGSGGRAVQGAARPPSAAIHLAATGDQGFGRRLRLSFPLIHQGVASMVHESPFYGARRPAAQKGSKLLRVSDLLTLGWATIYESINLLHWLCQEGYDEGGLCMAGLSMGGVHACMTAALCPHDVAVAALLAPRSAAVAYVDGALSTAMAWEPLLREADDRDANVLQVIGSNAQPISVLRQATYALQELEYARDVGSAHATDADAEAAAARKMGVRVTPSTEPAAAAAGGASLDGAGSASALPQTPANPSASPPSQQPADAAASSSSSQQHHVHAGHPQHPHPNSHAAQGSERPHPPPHKKRLLPIDLPIDLPSLSVPALEGLQRGLSELVRLRAGDSRLARTETLDRLKRVLETYTDITRFPVPRRPDSAVFVAAKDDGYVSLDSVQELHQYWPGSELRMVSGGHVTAFLMHHDRFRGAIAD
eukprot:CAMPEP_0202860166 /NCGR_PEP_ID=MMETSP1391-20130828/1990_1 /ASSEMBLY_ACC=CAM_ASM_000867 /TAXON_ID=1034604 /ORGANISM="Chlamydomonas leiostraca, Strain SAG 11-49" /LENGTH=577 /DNA_ID=CAMNT_0049539305 /DNA_START=86 /DNA_END=1816 /DNA_ORIENTATION=-